MRAVWGLCWSALPPGALLKGKTHLLGDGKTGFNSRFTEYTHATYRKDSCLHDTNNKLYLCVKISINGPHKPKTDHQPGDWGTAGWLPSGCSPRRAWQGPAASWPGQWATGAWPGWPVGRRKPRGYRGGALIFCSRPIGPFFFFFFLRDKS